MPARKSLLLGVAALVAVVSLIVTANLWKTDLRIDTVIVEGNAIVAKEEIARLTGIRGKDVMFDLDLFAVRQRVLRNQYIREASVEREAPGTILVRVEERVPVAVVNAGGLFMIDAGGFILPSVASPGIFDVPVISGRFSGSELVAGQIVAEPAILEALQVVEALRRVGDDVDGEISEIHLAGREELVLFTVEGVPVLIGTGGYEEKLVRFAAFWSQVAMQGNLRELEVVDLRYRDQVIARWKNGPPEFPESDQHSVTATSGLSGRKVGVS
jgi:cell division protein FtsQ